MRKTIITLAIAIAAVLGTVGVSYGLTSHDPNVVGGRFCVDFGTNTAHYDWHNVPCGANQYLDQNTYSQPVVPTTPTTVTVTNNVTAVIPGPQNMTLDVPSDSHLVTVLGIIDQTRPSISVPFSEVTTDAFKGDITVTYTGTAAETPTNGDVLVVTYSTARN